MARTIREAAMSTRTARARLRRGRQPHWNAIGARTHLGYQRWDDGERAGRWILRRRIAGRYSTISIGAADDAIEADGLSVLSYHEARVRALELAGGERVVGSITVARAVEDYLRDLRARGKSTDTAEAAALYILPELGDCPVADLTTERLQNWLAAVAALPARALARTSGGTRTKNVRVSIDGDEATRKRKNSANRNAGVLIAALNLARRRKQAPSDDAWRELKKFEGVSAARARYLSIAESVRLLNACPEDFRRLVRAALSTGCRYGELCRLTVADYNPDVGTLAVWKSKTNKPRHVVLTDEGVEFFRQLAAGRSGAERLLLREGGEPWQRSNQAQPMRAACANAKIDPRISFHGLRHTYASLAIMNGVPLMVVARNLGHADTRMCEKHYGHLADSYIGDAIRAGAPRFGVEPGGNVRPLNPGKRRGIV